MKKYSFIILGLFLVTTIGCKKEDIRPNSNQFLNDTYIAPFENDTEDGTYDGNAYGGGGFTFDKPSNDTIIDITDPDRDDDDIKKIKRKN